MTSLAHRLRRRVRHLVLRVVGRAPWTITTRGLQRRVAATLLLWLNGSPQRREQARRVLAALARSGNPRAAHTALHVWGRRTVPPDDLTALTTPHGRATRDGSTALTLVRLSVRHGDDDGLRRTLARAADRRVRGVEAAAIATEIVGTGDRALMAALAPLATRTDQPAQVRALVAAVAAVGRRLDDEPPARILADVAEEPLAVEALTTGLPADVGLDDLTELGSALARTPTATPASLRRTAQALRRRGGLRVLLELDEQLARIGPADERSHVKTTAGRELVDLLDNGWAPLDEDVVAHQSRARTVDYLLHSSLPHVSLGYSTRSHGLLTALNAAGWDVRGVTRPSFPYGRPVEAEGDVAAEDLIDGVRYRRLLDGHQVVPLSPLRDYVDTYVRMAEPALRERGTCLVHAASNHRNGMAAAALGRRLGIPTVYEVRGLWEYTRLAREPGFDRSDLFTLLARLEVDACRAADRVITITAALKGVLVDRGVDADSIVVVPNGVNTRRFRPMDRDVELATELGIGERTVIGYVGTVQHYEGLALLLDAAATLRRTRDDFALLIVGDGEAAGDLAAQADALDLGGTVVFTGRVPHDQVERYYSLIDIAPFPRLPLTVCELVSPLKPFEAMAMGKAVVVSSVAALAEIVQDGRTGLVFEKGSASALARSLEQLLDDPTTARQIADEGRRTVAAERDWSVLADRVTAVYRDLTGAATSPHTST